MTKIYWLSFCDDDKATGEKLLGVAIVEAPDTVAAVKLAHEKKCNPGGEVMAVGIEITDEELARAKPYMYRVLDRAECIAFDTAMRNDGEVGAVHQIGDLPKDRLDRIAEGVCTTHNIGDSK